MAGKVSRNTLLLNADLRNPEVDTGTFVSPTLTTPAITGGTQSAPSITNPTVTTGTFATPALTTPTLTGALSGGTLNTDLAGAAAAVDGNLVEADTNPTVLPTNATVDLKGPQVKKLTITLAADTLDILAANDYGSLQLSGDMPAFYRVLATELDFTFTHTDLTGDASTVDVGVGSVATASTDFLGSGEGDVWSSQDATGTTTGTVDVGPAVGAAMTTSSGNLFLQASSPVTAGTGVLTLTGDIVIWYIPLL